MKQRAFVLHHADNVATALDDLTVGPVTLLGETTLPEAQCLEPVKFGYKIALTDLAPGDPVVKNNVVIAEAFLEIRKGEMVHLHNIRSRFDERSGSLDHETGAPTEDFYR
jgi:altronate dehydratase small subunit